MRTDLLLLASDLARQGEAFALATVVRREPPSSARVGDAALITRSGTFHGWLGGSCTTPTTVREALRALADGTPRLVALSPAPDTDQRPGVISLPMTCHSGGSVDIYIEPVLPAARLAVFGTSPVAQALARLGRAMGYAVDAVDPAADRATFPEADRVLTDLDAAELRLLASAPNAQVFAVVATMGQSDEDAMEAALRLKAVYLGVVASRRRFEELRQVVVARGTPAADLDRFRSPAGLDIGARAPAEIALSILAEIVTLRRQAAAGAPEATLDSLHAAGASRAAAAAPPVPATESKDPVCGMMVRMTGARHTANLGGRAWYFCCAGCQDKFVREPHKYLVAAGGAG